MRTTTIVTVMAPPGPPADATHVHFWTSAAPAGAVSFHADEALSETVTLSPAGVRVVAAELAAGVRTPDTVFGGRDKGVVLTSRRGLVVLIDWLRDAEVPLGPAANTAPVAAAVAATLPSRGGHHATPLASSSSSSSSSFMTEVRLARSPRAIDDAATVVDLSPALRGNVLTLVNAAWSGVLTCPLTALVSAALTLDTRGVKLATHSSEGIYHEADYPGEDIRFAGVNEAVPAERYSVSDQTMRALDAHLSFPPWWRSAAFNALRPAEATRRADNIVWLHLDADGTVWAETRSGDLASRGHGPDLPLCRGNRLRWWLSATLERVVGYLMNPPRQ